MLGSTVSGYRVEGKLGEGAMGEVFLGVHALIGKRVAIKVLRQEHSQNAEVVGRFFREARAATLIGHASTVGVIDTGRLDDGRGFIIMELLDGESLRDRLTRAPRLGQSEQIEIGRQLAEALAAAHDKGIWHRDLKPENVFLVRDAAMPGGTRVKLLDFGVAKLTEVGPAMMTNPNALIGTPAYMAPEQCKGASFVDAQSDIYALGVILYEMAAGRTPFVGRGFGDYLMAHLTEPVPPLAQLATVDPRLERIILRALAKEKRDRQASMAELARELEALAAPKQPSATPASPRLISGAEAETVRGLSVPAELLAAAAQHMQPAAPSSQRMQPAAPSSQAATVRSAPVPPLRPPHRSRAPIYVTIALGLLVLLAIAARLAR